MKKFIALSLILIVLSLSFSSCGPKDAIQIAPHDLNMPDTYQIVYTVVTDGTGENDDDIATVVCGCDADGNFYYSYTGKLENEKILCIGSDDSYKEYRFNEETGKYELTNESVRWVSAFVACNEYVEYANEVIDDTGEKKTYEKIDALTKMPDGVSGKAIDFSDTERFEYYAVTGRVFASGAEFEGFETVIEKATGACVYVNYFGQKNLSENNKATYYFYATEYTTPYSGSYGSFLTN